MKKPVSFALAIVASLLLSACGGTSGGQSSPPVAVQAQKQQAVPTASAVCNSLVEMLNPTKLCPRPQEKDGVIFSQEQDVRLQILPDGKIMLVNVRANQARTKSQLISLTKQDQSAASAFAAALAALVAAQGAKQIASTANYAVEALQQPQNAVEVRVSVPTSVSKQKTAGGNGKPQVVTKMTLKCVNGGQFHLTLSDNKQNTVDETGNRAGCWQVQALDFLRSIRHKVPKSALDLFEQIVREIEMLKGGG